MMPFSFSIPVSLPWNYLPSFVVMLIPDLVYLPRSQGLSFGKEVAVLPPSPSCTDVWINQGRYSLIPKPISFRSTGKLTILFLDSPIPGIFWPALFVALGSSLSIGLAKRSQHFNATLLHDVATCVEWTGQTHATYRNRVAKRTQHVVPNNVARFCVEMLPAFGQAFRG